MKPNVMLSWIPFCSSANSNGFVSNVLSRLFESKVLLPTKKFSIQKLKHSYPASTEILPSAQSVSVPSKNWESELTIAKVDSLGEKLGRQEWGLG